MIDLEFVYRDPKPHYLAILGRFAGGDVMQRRQKLRRRVHCKVEHWWNDTGASYSCREAIVPVVLL